MTEPTRAEPPVRLGPPLAPPYGEGTLSELMPSVAHSLGLLQLDGVSGLALPAAPRVIVLLVDGLGDTLLRARSGHAPFLRSLLQSGRQLSSGFPSTTATSMGSFGTGLTPGTHGMLGYEVLDPARDVLLNELSWEPYVDPRAWQPRATVFEQVAAAGVQVTRIGPSFFDGSGLTESALRGGSFVAAHDLDERVDAAVAAAHSAPRSLVYVYWGDLDKVGHVHGCASFEWGEELERIDAATQRLSEQMPRDAVLHVTADHGMVDVAMADRLDLAYEPDLAAGVRHSGGEPRALHLYCEHGAAPDVLAAWRERLGERSWIRSRSEAVAAGWFGPVDPALLSRIGDVVVANGPGLAVVDSRHQRAQLLALIGLHGSLTVEETAVPLLSVAGERV